MKKLMIALVLSVTASSAFADLIDFPDFSMEQTYEKNYVAKDAEVLAFAADLGATKIKVVTGGALRVYQVQTNSGCAFSVKVVYNKWPGIDAVVINKNATCK
jgi:hypothetical protein